MAKIINQILVTNGYGYNSKEPFVQLEGDGIRFPLQIDPNAARELAAALLQAAEAAEQDNFLFEFATKELHQDDRVGAGIVAAFRQWRIDRGMNQ